MGTPSRRWRWVKWEVTREQWHRCTERKLGMHLLTPKTPLRRGSTTSKRSRSSWHSSSELLLSDNSQYEVDRGFAAVSTGDGRRRATELHTVLSGSMKNSRNRNVKDSGPPLADNDMAPRDPRRRSVGDLTRCGSRSLS